MTKVDRVVLAVPDANVARAHLPGSRAPRDDTSTQLRVRLSG